MPFLLSHFEQVRPISSGGLAIDNNLSERRPRAIARSRKKWGVLGSEVGDQTAAVWLPDCWRKVS